MELILATRKSKLAQTQTETVMAMLKEKHKIDAKKLLVVTEGDKRLDVTLDKIGGKGLFVKEIELALLEGKAQGAVHSMKDVPYELAEDFEISSNARKRRCKRCSCIKRWNCLKGFKKRSYNWNK